MFLTAGPLPHPKKWYGGVLGRESGEYIAEKTLTSDVKMTDFGAPQ